MIPSQRVKRKTTTPSHCAKLLQAMASATQLFSTAVRRLEGKVALITGGARGIGECVAKVFTQHGARVVIADIRDDLGQSVCEDLGSSTTSYVHCDVTDEGQVQNVVDSTMVRYGKLDIMFNNAGVSEKPKPFLENSQSDFEQVIKTNLIGTFLGTKHAARVMIPAQRGSIIATSSVASVLGGMAPHAYTSSKHGIVGLVKNTAVELGKYGIRVNCVSPYAVFTPLVRETINITEEDMANFYSNLKGTWCKAEDVANAALFLASDESKFVSGHNLIIDGGFTIMNQGFCMF